MTAYHHDCFSFRVADSRNPVEGSVEDQGHQQSVGPGTVGFRVDAVWWEFDVVGRTHAKRSPMKPDRLSHRRIGARAFRARRTQPAIAQRRWPPSAVNAVLRGWCVSQWWQFVMLAGAYLQLVRIGRREVPG